MKILITTDCYLPMINGVVTSVTTLQKELLKRGHEVKVIALSETRHAKRQGDVYYMGSVGAGRIYPQARAAAPGNGRLLREIEAWKPDIIHSQSEFSSFFAAKRIAARLNRPIVHTYHTVYEDYTHYFSPNQALGKRAAAILSRMVVNKTQAVVVPTVKVQRLLESYGIKTPMYVVPSGIFTDRFKRRPEESRITALKKELGIGEEKKVMVTVGRLAREKNVEELIDYFDRLNRPDLEFLIVGDGPHRACLEKYASGFPLGNRIHFAGMVEPLKIADYYYVGDVFACASQSETQGLTYAEALACGLPVIGRMDDCIEGTVLDGVNGCRYRNYEEFRRAAEQILDGGDYGRMSENARQKGMENSAGRFADRILGVYEETLSCGESK